jgi:hypothetical protein
MKVRYALHFPPLHVVQSQSAGATESLPPNKHDGRSPSADLVSELAGLIRFKTATFTDAGMHRRGVWNDETASQKIEHLGLMFGALAADPCGPVRGRGVPVQQLTLALLAFPAVWDWYLQWRQQRRGFFTSWELNMLSLGLSLLGRPTGWLRQMPHIAERLEPIPGLLAAEEVDSARRDWNGICEIAQRHGLARIKEIARVRAFIATLSSQSFPFSKTRIRSARTAGSRSKCSAACPTGNAIRVPRQRWHAPS